MGQRTVAGLLAAFGASQCLVGLWPTLISAAIVAVTAPLMPWPLWLVAGYVLFDAHAVGGLIAFAVGIVVTAVGRWGGPRAGLVAVAVLLLVGAQGHWFRLLKATFTQRLDVWAEAGRHLSGRALLVGHGLGAWPRDSATWIVPSATTAWPVACNDLVQWVYETGALGLVLLALVLWKLRRIVQSRRWAGSLAALAVTTQYAFPFHSWPLTLVGLTTIGMAWADAR